ncbi:enamine deaminase RidA (YjgF/YER057c/UK114 family) [Actinokineospora auranticolor]|uniref:Enamine deaminase RidA (YjgF/YER057c/UK114 family) n=1 Tax=Actinokineospora auranticolor TaxID=155976 RepID=A0A2S6H1S4_9PSEU|nr:enamine deaminase RidA (YjgF/YER057c/UK114 family) [Actinokineospora auranticolor]
MKKFVDNPAGVPAPPPGRYSHVSRVEIADTVTLTLAGQCAIGDDLSVVAPGDIVGQTDRVFEIIGILLAAHGATFADITSTRTYLTDMDDRAAYAETRAKYLPADALPPSTVVEVSRLFLPDVVVEVEVVAVRELDRA